MLASITITITITTTTTIILGALFMLPHSLLRGPYISKRGSRTTLVDSWMHRLEIKDICHVNMLTGIMHITGVIEKVLQQK